MNSSGDVVCIGESMAVFVPAAAPRSWTEGVGGAESNVACHLVGHGFRSRWVSALGDDSFGRAVLGRVRAAGVDTTDVHIDPARPTGLYFKQPGAVTYYRRGSAASALGADLLDRISLAHTRLVHVSGITAALSPSCLDLLRAVLRDRRGDYLVSFDVNWRPALWERGGGPELLRELADSADIVLVGSDEAEALWGTDDPAQVRSLLPGPKTLVVKQGADGATLIEDGRRVFEPALSVDVVEPVGAGDAFAAGFLASTLDGREPGRRLRAGHLSAAGTLLTHEDVGEALPAELVSALLEADEPAWRGARVSTEGVRLG
ncbi:sugar kinase [Allokutzneria sp. NRRL B-24872]|uniref:sugar kinase n=1 Tax=Allokutzneria sp. NRRL B-24872 TaxID=1137961 RepID=UPI002110F1AD|nr:sugar kinase [Allokutzneria sp. NRRL B-24872]